jgi:hypothetical protein
VDGENVKFSGYLHAYKRHNDAKSAAGIFFIFSLSGFSTPAVPASYQRFCNSQYFISVVTVHVLRPPTTSRHIQKQQQCWQSQPAQQCHVSQYDG